MGMTNFYSGGMRYSPCGRKRKTNAYKTKKRTPDSSSVYTPTQRELDAHQARLNFNKKYPSYVPDRKTDITRHDDSWKLEESKKFTVAPAYNKGAYQVIPQSDLEHIGK